MKTLLKIETNLNFRLIFILTSISWEYKFNFTNFNSFNFKCVKKIHILFIFS
jgi:hypothetical protein